MSSRVILAGGNFQDAEGNVLANGYLIMALSQDAQVNSNTQVVGGRKIKILLDTAGNVITSPSQSVWGNDVLNPTSTYYLVSGYTSSGQLAWGPNPVIVTSGSYEFDVGTWVPPQITIGPNVTVTQQNIILETNGTPNASQNTLNLQSGSNVTLTSLAGGAVKISASGGGGGGGGKNVVTFSTTPVFDLSLGTTQIITLTGNVTSSTVINGTDGQTYLFIIIQDSVGGHTFTWPATFKNAGPIDSFDNTAAASSAAVQQFVENQSTNSYYAVTAMIYNQ